jgi:hypothetical protein
LACSILQVSRYRGDGQGVWRWGGTDGLDGLVCTLVSVYSRPNHFDRACMMVVKHNIIEHKEQAVIYKRLPNND